MRDHTAVIHSFDRFRAIRREMGEAQDDPNPTSSVWLLRDNAVFGIGVLIGGAAPGAAAAVSVLLERAFPDVRNWPWEPVE